MVACGTSFSSAHQSPISRAPAPSRIQLDKICTRLTKPCGERGTEDSHTDGMHRFTACALATHRLPLLKRWEESLRALPPSSGLAHPDSLVHLMASTLERVIAVLGASRAPLQRSSTPDCACGMNPLIAFFVTAEAAMIDTLFTAEPTWAGLSHADREGSLNVLRAALAEVACDDIEVFCSLCQYRRHPPVTTREISSTR